MSLNFPFLFLIPLVALCGCGEPAASPEGNLRQAFAQAPEAVQTQAGLAEAALHSTNYGDGLAALNRLLAQHQPTESERAAVTKAFSEVTKALVENPSLDSPELFKARSQLMQKLYGPL